MKGRGDSGSLGTMSSTTSLHALNLDYQLVMFTTHAETPQCAFKILSFLNLYLSKLTM